jgi:hypothetical protein
MRATDVLRRGYAAFGQVIASDSRQLHSALCNVENYIDEPWTQALYNRYLECYIEDNVTFGATFYDLGEGRRGTPAMHLFVEMARAHFILRYRQLMEEVKAGNGVIIPFSLSKCQSPIWYQPDETSPVMTYTQSQITDCLLWLSRRLDDIHGYDELVETELALIVNVLMTRNSVFFCEACQGTTLDLEHMRVGQGDGSFVPNRDYVMFVTIYFNAVMRRLYYLGKAKRKLVPVPDIENRVETFFQAARISEEVFETLYEAAVVRSFTCAGDKAWFTYRCPNRADTDPASVLAEAREQEEVEEFRTWIKNPPSADVMLAAAFDMASSSTINRIARNLVLLMLDVRIREMYNVRWFNAVLVPNESIERSTDRIVRPRSPMLVQLFGGDYWVQGKQGLYATTGVAQLIATWFWLLRTEFDSRLHQVDMSALCGAILDPPPDSEEETRLGIQPL